MNRINLRYIGATDLAKNISNCNDLIQLKDLLLDLLNADIGRIECYIDKYDNEYDKLEVDLSELKEEKQRIFDLFNKLTKKD